MYIIGFVLAIQFITIVAYLLFKKYNPQAVLLFGGLLMLVFAILLGLKPQLPNHSGLAVFDLFTAIEGSFLRKLAEVGIMIMTIGGFVSYMRKIGASDALVYMSMQPLFILRKSPYLAAAMVIPIGQLLFICIPSATGLGLLLIASIFPVLIGLGISRISAVSVITACTVFDMGPVSVNTARAAELIGKSKIVYFLEDQLPLTIPLTLVLMVLYVLVNRYFDRKNGHITAEIKPREFQYKVPLIYGILPILPLVLLVVFSTLFRFFDPPIELSTTTAMLISLCIAVIFETFRTKQLFVAFASLRIFWEGMGKLFTSVITLIVCAEVFSMGLIGLGFIDSLVGAARFIGMGTSGIGVIMTCMAFFTSILLGSGNATFFTFGPAASLITSSLGMNGVSVLLPMQLATSMGRASSPISGIIIAASDIAQVSPFELAKRNVIPLGITLLVMLILNGLIG